MSPQTLTRTSPLASHPASASLGASAALVAETRRIESAESAESVALETSESKLSAQELELWLRFQFNTASYIDPSYKAILLAARGNGNGRAGASDNLASKNENFSADFLGQLWGDASLSRHIFEFFSLDFSAFPRARSELAFFVRLAMIDAADLQRLLFSMGLVLSSGELALFIDRAAVANLREQLGERDYLFASGRARELCPSADWISLQLDEATRGRLSERDFHLEIGLRLLLLHCQNGYEDGNKKFDEQILRRLALKCPYSVVSRIERSAEEGLAFGLAVFADADDTSANEVSQTDATSASSEISTRTRTRNRTESLWLGLASEVIERWHAWLAY